MHYWRQIFVLDSDVVKTQICLVVSRGLARETKATDPYP